MIGQKKSVHGLQARSNKVLSVFRSTIDDLKKIAQEATELRAVKTEQISNLTGEVNAIDKMSEENGNTIAKLEDLIGSN